jgi:ABC-type bacteriocin/lantibiotic exporter with double-glycine peptidase domain
MNQKILRKTLEAFARRSNHVFDPGSIARPLAEERTYQPREIALFINDFILQAGSIEIACKLNYLDEDQFRFATKELGNPFLVFETTNAGWMPVVLFPDEKGNIRAERILAQGSQELEGHEIEPAQLAQDTDPNLPAGEKKFLLVTGLAWRAMISHFYPEKHEEKTLSPAKRLFRLLGNEKKDIGYIYVYGVVIGLISLSLPIGIQSIINLISGGRFFNSVVVLISLVIVGVLISGGLQIMQMTLVEILQRRIFAKASFELAYRIPRIRMESLAGYYPPELMNRFFEVVNIQKGLPKLLIDVSAASLQILFGLLLLSFYHPFFIVFSLVLLAIVYLIFHFTGRKGLDTSLMESKYKYKIAQWFEELARTLASFKLAGTTNLPLEKTDKFVNNYLIYRKKHFGILILQYGNVLAFKTLVTAGILIIGTILVVDRQITLGQFVASELVIIIVVAALEKIILNIDVFYDLLTAVEKLGFVTDFPLEKSTGFVDQLPARPAGLEVHLKDLHFSFPNSEKEALKGLTLHIPPGARFCISGYSESGKETLARLLGGIYTGYSGSFIVNGISFRDIEINHYRDRVSKNFDRSEIFDGTILENITLGKPGIFHRDVVRILEKLHLMDDINRLPHGILTDLVGTGNMLSNSVLEKLILARCMVTNPALLIVSYPIMMVERSERNEIYQVLMDRSLPATIGFVSNDQDLQRACDLVLVLEKGRLLASGTYAEVKPYLDGI